MPPTASRTAHRTRKIRPPDSVNIVSRRAKSPPKTRRPRARRAPITQRFNARIQVGRRADFTPQSIRRRAKIARPTRPPKLSGGVSVPDERKRTHRFCAVRNALQHRESSRPRARSRKFRRPEGILPRGVIVPSREGGGAITSKFEGVTRAKKSQERQYARCRAMASVIRVESRQAFERRGKRT